MPARGGMRCLWPGNHQGPRIVDSAQLGRPSVDSWDPRIPGWARLQRLTIGPRSGRTENAEDDGNDEGVPAAEGDAEYDDEASDWDPDSDSAIDLVDIVGDFLRISLLKSTIGTLRVHSLEPHPSHQ